MENNPIESLENAPAPTSSSRRISPKRDLAGFRRKRALAACQLCRLRKIKCDNQRPTCGTCVSAGARCSFSHQELDVSGLDRGTLAILDKLSSLSLAVDFQSRQLSEITEKSTRIESRQVEQVAASLRTTTATTAGGERSSIFADVSSAGSALKESDDTLEYSLKPSAPLSPGRIYGWPVFRSGNGGDDLLSSPFQHYITPGAEGATEASYTSSFYRRTLNVEDDDIVHLVERYLVNVHTKHPFVNVDVLKREARRAKEYGADSSAWGCTVVRTHPASIVAKASHHYNPAENQPPPNPGLRDGSTATAAAFFELAGKRLSLLKPGWLSIQCLLLAATYHMYRLQPVAAWTFISQACQRYWLYSRGNVKAPSFLSNVLGEDEDYQRQLYWFCFKAESELRVYLDVPETGITRLHPKEHFPPLPDGIFNTQTGFPVASRPQVDQQQNWYFSLTDFSLRRLGNHILNSFYFSEWESLLRLPTDDMVTQSAEFLAQLDGVCNLYPVDPHQGDNELQYVVRTRILIIKCSLLIPFVYKAIHSSDQHSSALNNLSSASSGGDPMQERVREFFSCASEVIEEFTTCNRSYGLWFLGQCCTSCALVIIAAALSSREKTNTSGQAGSQGALTGISAAISSALPSKWSCTVLRVVQTLRKWEVESFDFKVNADLIESLVA
ncbi:hypothetical protein CC79DRAFT_1361754 [Sarocladium strictum]